MSHNLWWKGFRGEWYLVIQAALFLLLAFGPRTYRGMPEWQPPYDLFATRTGCILIFAGVILGATGAISLGKNLTPLPTPKKNAKLVITGAYRLVRHPIYSGIIFCSFGFGLWQHSFMTIVYALLLLVFFDIKSRYEERLLHEMFSEYDAYRKRVRKLIPFVY